MRISAKFLIINFLILNLSLVYAIIGRTEIFGGTAFDYWSSPPIKTWSVNDPNYGIHSTWMWSNTSTFIDRNMKYNFYDWTTRTWAFNVGTSYMGYGTFVFPHTLVSVPGGSDLDPITGNFVISGQYTPTGQLRRPKLARDIYPGSGTFEYCESPSTWYWPAIAVSNNQAIHVAVINGIAPNETLYYSRVQPWGIWSPYIRICPPLSVPLGPTHNIQASHTSNKVIITWTNWRVTPRIDSGYYRLSLDGGMTWQAPVALPFPPTTLDSASFYITGMFAHFDQNDNFHLVTALHSNRYTWPAEIWHYCPTNNPQWSMIHHRDCDTLAGSVGYNALSACRASITRNPSNNYLYAVWEMFDSLNVEPITGYTRADIWVAESRDNGLTWPYKIRITDPNTMSKRFPIAAGVQVTPVPTPDTLIVTYLADSIAGFLVQNEHRFCVNPMVCHFVPIPFTAGGLEEYSQNPITTSSLNISPNPFTSQTAIRYSLPAQNKVSLEIYDVTGRLIKTLSPHSSLLTTHYSFIWNGQDSQGKTVKNGVYFCTLKTNGKTITKKIVKSD